MQSTITGDFSNIRQTVCISTGKIMDACRDQDCMEHVAVYLTSQSQDALEGATTVKARCADLLYADVSVEPLGFRDGYYCVNIQYYYRIIVDTVLCAVRPASIYGLATVSKRVSLFGGCAEALRFTSHGDRTCSEVPVAVVEALPPTILGARIVDLCQCRKEEPRCCALGEGLPEAVSGAFDDELVMGGMNRQLQVTLGQFSLVRLERQTQLQIPAYDYCIPEKVCCDGDCCCQENPCEAFCSTEFPVDAFFPQGEPGSLNGTCRRSGCGGCGRQSCTCNACENARTAPDQVYREETGEDCESTVGPGFSARGRK